MNTCRKNKIWRCFLWNIALTSFFKTIKLNSTDSYFVSHSLKLNHYQSFFLQVVLKHRYSLFCFKSLFVHVILKYSFIIWIKVFSLNAKFIFVDILLFSWYCVCWKFENTARMARWTWVAEGRPEWGVKHETESRAEPRGPGGTWSGILKFFNSQNIRLKQNKILTNKRINSTNGNTIMSM